LWDGNTDTVCYFGTVHITRGVGLLGIWFVHLVAFARIILMIMRVLFASVCTNKGHMYIYTFKDVKLRIMIIE